MNDAEELEKFKREINLGELAGSYGYAIDDKASCRTCLVMRHHGSKIVVATAEDGHGIFFDVKGDCKGGSVIDFVMWQKGVTLGGARKILREYTGAQQNFSFPATHRTFSKPEPVSRDRAGLFAKWQGMQPYRAGYLEGRGITPATISKFAGQIRTDQRGNTCFRHDDEKGLSGWEAKNKGFTGFAGGGNKALFACQVAAHPGEQPPIIVIAEGAIDALSFYEVNPTAGLYISIGGNMSPEQQEQLKATLTRYPDALILTATDNDLDGEKYANLILTMRPDAVRAAPPTGKDWNDTLNQRQARAR